MRYLQNFKKWWYWAVSALLLLSVLLYIFYPFLKKGNQKESLKFQDSYEKYRQDSIKHSELIDKLLELDYAMKKQESYYYRTIDNQKQIINDIRSKNREFRERRDFVGDSVYNLNAIELQGAFADYFNEYRIR